MVRLVFHALGSSRGQRFMDCLVLAVWDPSGWLDLVNGDETSRARGGGLGSSCG